MKRVVLVHWNAEEADRRAARLRQAGYDVSCHSDSRAGPQALRENPPDAYVIDLARLPSQGRELGGWLRRQRATRSVPFIFTEGDPEKTARVRALLPDATFASWDDIVTSLVDAIEHPIEEPIVPGTMDAYSNVPLEKKLGISPGAAVALIQAPPDVERRVRQSPSAAIVLPDGAETAEVILWFVTSLEALESGFAAVASRLRDGGRLWIAWPKKTSGTASDLSQTVVRAYGLERGLVDYKIASIDETWSALCFARRENGGKEPE